MLSWDIIDQSKLFDTKCIYAQNQYLSNLEQ